jgi:hypothetical protein
MLDNRIIVKNAEDQSIPIQNDAAIYIVVGTYSMRYAAGQETIRLSGTIQASAEEHFSCNPITGELSSTEPAEFEAEAYGRTDAYKDYPYFYYNGEWYYTLSRYIVGTGYSRMTAKKCVAVQQ